MQPAVGVDERFYAKASFLKQTSFEWIDSNLKSTADGEGSSIM